MNVEKIKKDIDKVIQQIQRLENLMDEKRNNAGYVQEPYEKLIETKLERLHLLETLLKYS